ncbi:MULTISPECIES: TraB/VirB10 family protein [Sphingobium]|uniref:Conjugal transfer protein TraB n=2 Tax=Sphingobium TaxID=165695 RepID=A0A0M3AH48_9SPHN|nr:MULTISPECIES: TraB/VirB10 family protein [Sphingobium]OAP30384.1 conjugal transfer protein TraB [Sphingobium sp. 20006FA]KKW89353.1 conjugal transfer protein TraB [Sphingobium chungbukense]KXU30836.1 conjugal transfer protein TraB [Sphingobium sp. AM]KYC30663.1 conjugal transfer protein TraB [Sphingobium sp. 22B]MCB4858998.1 TraB/VirB10 family protein [Sphingobium sp. PNB]
MALADLFSRKRRTLDADQEAGEGVSPVSADLAGNEAVRRKQQLLLAGAAGIGLIASSFWIFSGDEKKEDPKATSGEEIDVSTKDLVNRNLSQQEWMAMSENQFQAQENQLKAVGGQQRRMDQLASQVEALKAQNQSMQADGQRVLTAYQAENEQLKRQISERRTAQPAMAGPSALYGPNGPQVYQRPDAPGDAGAVRADALPRGNEVKMVSFTSSDSGIASKVAKGNTVYTDSPNYLPPNSFARARVIVGVDASAGVNSQTDPLPVVLRITGPARSVFANGKLLTTKIEGCLINGAARGDLSSEKVYVKLQKMTCPQPGGRYAVSEVKGFIAFGGKTGVRGRVVSREGSLVTQAFMAGLVGGFGRGFSANANSVFQGTNISTNGKRDKLSTGDILEGGLGEGVAQTGDIVSKYLIERAEQYQPVIEMPTGIDVEIVFLEGVYVRN